MRILHLIPSLGGGGAERQISLLAGGLRAAGCEVHVAILRDGPHFERLERSGTMVHRIRARGNYDPLLVPRIVRLIRGVRPDIVQTWLTQMDVAGGAAALWTGTPWIVSERSSGLHYPRDLRHALRRFLGRFADAIVANSKGGLHFWKATCARRFIVSNAVDLDAIDASRPDDVETDGRPIVLFAGRLDQEKNLPTFIRALAEVMHARDVIALFCGSGPLESEVRERVNALGLSERIRLLGFTDRLWSLMKRADLFVTVSWFEGQPNAVLEAAASGCPLVLSDIESHRENFGESTAILVPPGDARAIAAAIAGVLDDPASARERARNAREVVSGFTIPAIAAAYLHIYERLVLTTAPESDAVVHRH
jgi:glycosyltransferase involved in cell wall biosynthesis